MENRIIKYFEDLIKIDSTTGQYEEVEDYLVTTITKLGYAPKRLRQGGVIVDLGGTGNDLYVMAHCDDIGLMVRAILPDGTLKVCQVGGLRPHCAERENVRIYTQNEKVYTGCVQRRNSCVHIAPVGYNEEPADYEKNLCVMIDEPVECAADVEALGISVGDIIALEPRYVLTENGYIKSRFVDDKACAAVLLSLLEELSEKQFTLNRHVTFGFTMYEEIGHGGSWIPEGTMDVLALDIACAGPTNTSDERKVSIFAKDAKFPYHRGMMKELLETGKINEIDYTVDVFTPSYSTDSDTALIAGHDVRHAAIGPGTLGSHGYERTHMKGLENTKDLLKCYISK